MVYEELFEEGTEPTTTCDTHVVTNINRLNNKLATPGTPSFLTRKAIYIKKKHPNSATADYYMVLPSSYDTTTSETEEQSTETGENNNSNVNHENT
ncbi:Membrane carboxypeptidase MrcB, partial [human gut metagenome]